MNIPGVAFVTGASKGIGRATAIAFAAAGVSGLVLSARNKEELESAAQEAQKVATHPKFKPLVVTADLRSEEEIVKSVEKAVETFGRIDYVANVAGIIAEGFTAFADTPMDAIDRMYQTNQRPTYILTREQLKVMRKQEPLVTPLHSTDRPADRGSIINVSSTVAENVPMSMAVSYVGSKYGVNGMTKVAAADHGPDGIRVNIVSPGYTMTEGVKAHPNLSPELFEHLCSGTALRRLGTSEEIADVIVFLSSPRASFVTGVNWIVDGGWSII